MGYDETNTVAHVTTTTAGLFALENADWAFPELVDKETTKNKELFMF